MQDTSKTAAARTSHHEGPTEAAATASALAHAKFRPDIEGLRAIAVGFVLLAHAGVPGMHGGFIGVDVFFVISGFLITGLLLREVDRTGRISFADFWARRAKRLLPAASIVLVASMLLTWWAMPVTTWRQICGDILASATYVINWRLASQSVDYFAGTEPSPVQHFWSLAVEEQYYLVWPLLIGLVVLATRGAVHRRRLAIGMALLCVIVPSLAWSIYATTTDPAKAYFVTHTRLWELGIGALVAVTATFWNRLPVRVATAVMWAGLIALVAVAIPLADEQNWPGSRALIPTLATTAVIAGGSRGVPNLPLRLLGSKPFLFVGGLSYGAYLWHWPLLVTFDAKYGPLPWPVKLLISLGSLVPAWFTLKFVENPVRFASVLRRPARRALAVGALCTVVGIGAAGTLNTLAVAQVQQVDTSEARGLGSAQTPAPTVHRKDGASPNPDPYLRPPEPGSLDLKPTSISPDPLVVSKNKPEHTCLSTIETTAPKICTAGDENSSTTIALVGDSKADHWADVLHTVGKEKGWKVVVITKASCPLTAQTIYRSRSAGNNYRECSTWNKAVMTLLTKDIRPAAVVTSGYASDALTNDGRPSSELMTAGYVAQWNLLKKAGIRVVALADIPNSPDDIIACVASARLTANSDCAFGRNDGNGTANLKQGAQQTASSFVNFNDWICPTENCPPVIGNVLVYRDDKHVSKLFADSMLPIVRARLVPHLAAAANTR